MTKRPPRIHNPLSILGHLVRSTRSACSFSVLAVGSADAVRSADATRSAYLARSTDAARSADATRSAYLTRSADAVRSAYATRSADAVRSTDATRSADAVRSAYLTRSVRAIRSGRSGRSGRLLILVLLAHASLLIFGCTPPRTHLLLESTTDSAHDQAIRLETDFAVALYRFDGTDTATIVLLDKPFDPAGPLPEYAVTVRMFWRPSAGRTPIAPDATNITVHHVIFARDPFRGKNELGIYTGAGFLLPLNKPGEKIFKTRILQANLLLDDHTASFKDRLGPALLTGPINARLDDAGVDTALEKINQLIRAGLGHPRLVGAPTNNLTD